MTKADDRLRERILEEIEELELEKENWDERLYEIDARLEQLNEWLEELEEEDD